MKNWFVNSKPDIEGYKKGTYMGVFEIAVWFKDHDTDIIPRYVIDTCLLDLAIWFDQNFGENFGIRIDE